MRRSPEPDVLVVGGGPAGLATAIAARQLGLDTLVVDRATPPIDKPCGEGIMPAGVAALARLGVDVTLCGRPFRGIRYLGDGVSVRADFAGVQGVALRRPVLHGLLVERARQLGVRFAWGTSVRSLQGSSLQTDAGELRGRWLVGADGLHSRVRRWSGLHQPARRRERFGIRRHYHCEPWSHDVEVYWADNCEAYVWGASDNEVGVAMLWSGDKSTFDSLLLRFPELGERLAGVPVSSRDRGAGLFDQRPRRLWRDRTVLVGDAAGYRDPITGEGLGIAFLEALALAACLAHGDLRSYPRAVRGITRLPYRFIRLLLAAEARPPVRRRLLRLLAAQPDLFRRMLATHSGDSLWRSLGWRGVRQLGAGLMFQSRR